MYWVLLASRFQHLRDTERRTDSFRSYTCNNIIHLKTPKLLLYFRTPIIIAITSLLVETLYVFVVNKSLIYRHNY